MPNSTVTINRRPRPPAALFMLLASTCLLFLSACGSGLVRGEPPFASVHSLEVDGSVLLVRLGLRNVNGVELDITSARFSITLELTQLIRFDETRQVTVVANGTETLRFEGPASEAGLELLKTLESGASPNLAYQLEGSITTVTDGVLKFKAESRLYPVPGRPGQFR